MALHEIAAGIGFGVICLGSCAGCYYMTGETARQDIKSTLDEEKAKTKKILSKMKKILRAEGQDDERLQKLQEEILVFPKEQKNMTDQVREAADVEETQLERLFTQLDTSEDKRLDYTEMAEFVRELANAMMAVESGLKKNRQTRSGRSTPNCLSRSERSLLDLIVGFVMAGVDVGGKLDGEVDIKEFKTLMKFLKVAMCRKDGHYRLKQIGLEGKIMTTDAWYAVLSKIDQIHEQMDTVYGKRSHSETEGGDSSDDDDGDSDDSEGSDSNDSERGGSDDSEGSGSGSETESDNSD